MLDDYVVAICPSPAVQDTVSDLPFVCDARSCTVPYDDIEQEVKNIVENTKIYTPNMEKKPIRSDLQIKLKLMTKGEVKKLLMGFGDILLEKVVFLRAELPKNSKGVPRYRVKYPKTSFLKNDHYVYWVADRPLFLRKIIFDASAFNYNNKTTLGVQPSFVNFHDRQYRDGLSEKKVEFNVDNWVSYGQGVILSWR